MGETQQAKNMGEEEKTVNKFEGLVEFQDEVCRKAGMDELPPMEKVLGSFPNHPPHWVAKWGDVNVLNGLDALSSEREPKYSEMLARIVDVFRSYPEVCKNQAQPKMSPVEVADLVGLAVSIVRGDLINLPTVVTIGSSKDLHVQLGRRRMMVLMLLYGVDVMIPYWEKHCSSITQAREQAQQDNVRLHKDPNLAGQATYVNGVIEDLALRGLLKGDEESVSEFKRRMMDGVLHGFDKNKRGHKEAFAGAWLFGYEQSRLAEVAEFVGLSPLDLAFKAARDGVEGEITNQNCVAVLHAMSNLRGVFNAESHYDLTVKMFGNAVMWLNAYRECVKEHLRAADAIMKRPDAGSFSMERVETVSGATSTWTLGAKVGEMRESGLLKLLSGFALGSAAEIAFVTLYGVGRDENRFDVPKRRDIELSARQYARVAIDYIMSFPTGANSTRITTGTWKPVFIGKVLNKKNDSGIRRKFEEVQKRHLAKMGRKGGTTISAMKRFFEAEEFIPWEIAAAEMDAKLAEKPAA